MANSTLTPAPAAPTQMPLRIDETRMTSTYANAIRTTPTNDEVVLDFGISLPRAAANGQPAQTFAIDTRVVVNWTNAKRLAISLAQMVQGYEQQHGEISLALPTGATTKR